MKRPGNEEWTDYADPEVVDWKRVRSALEHENTLTNARVTWLLSAQGFLLGAYMLVFTASTKHDFAPTTRPQVQVVLSAIVLAGVLISIFLSRGVLAAHEQHVRLRIWWENRPKYDSDRHPPICGFEPKFIVTIQYYRFPYIFLPVWFFLAFVPFLDLLGKYQTEILNALPFGIALLIFAAFGFLLGRTKAVKAG